MATSQASSHAGPHNPITDIEATHVNVTPDAALNAVSLQVTDQAGASFATLFDQDQALDVALRLAGAAARLKGLLPLTLPSGE